MAFTYDLDTDSGELRLAIGDTVEDTGPRPNGRNFSDAEITYFLGAGSVSRASVQAFDALAAEWSAYAGNSRLGPTAQASAQAKAYSERATELRQQLGGSNAVSGFSVATQPHRS
jgi:hypothetical protein